MFVINPVPERTNQSNSSYLYEVLLNCLKEEQLQEVAKICVEQAVKNTRKVIHSETSNYAYTCRMCIKRMCRWLERTPHILFYNGDELGLIDEMHEEIEDNRSYGVEKDDRVQEFTRNLLRIVQRYFEDAFRICIFACVNHYEKTRGTFKAVALRKHINLALSFLHEPIKTDDPKLVIAIREVLKDLKQRDHTNLAMLLDAFDTNLVEVTGTKRGNNNEVTARNLVKNRFVLVPVLNRWLLHNI